MNLIPFKTYPSQQKNCQDCSLTETFKEDWEPRHGSVKDWLELLKVTTLKDCQDWIECVDKIRWSKKESKFLYSEYVTHVSALSAAAHRKYVPTQANLHCTKLYNEQLNAKNKVHLKDVLSN